MALTVTFQWWSAENAYIAADILQDWTSGTITSLVTGLRGEGNAINLPSSLVRTQAKEGITGAQHIIFHARMRYDADAAPFLKLNTSTNSGPTFEMSSGTLTVKMSNGTVLGSVATGWGIGEKHTLSIQATLATNSTGVVKVWLDSTVILNLGGSATVPAASSVTADRIEINGFGVWDDIGFLTGSSGAVVDADTPLQKWVRLQMASLEGTNQGSGSWSAFGSGTTFLDRVNENPPDSTNGFQSGTGLDGTLVDFFCGSVPADVTDIWGVQFQMQGYQDGGSIVPRAVRIQVRSGGAPHSQVGTNVFTLSPTLFGKFLRLNPATGTAWSSATYAGTQIEFVSNS